MTRFSIHAMHSRLRIRYWRPLTFVSLVLVFCLEEGRASAQAPSFPLPLPSVSSGLMESLAPASPYQTDYVYLDGRPLFQVAVPTRTDQRPVATPLTERIRSIHHNLREIIQSAVDLTDPDIQVRIDPDTQSPVIYVGDQYLMTVTEVDAQAQGLAPQVWAWMISRRVREALQRYHQERQTPFLVRQALIAAGLLTVMVIGSGLLRRWQHRLQTRRQSLQSDLTLPEGSSEQGEPQRDLAVDLSGHNQLVWLDMQHRLTQGSFLVLWVGGLITITQLFPYTRWIYTFHSLFVRGRVFALLAVAAGTYVGIKLSNLSIHSLFSSIRRGQWLSLHQGASSSRISKRLDTLEGVIRGTTALALLTIGGLIAVGLMGVNIGPVLTSLGFIGLGISLAAQDLIKDLINGVMILLEDQFAEGDVIVVEGRGGLVEHINLRITQLRNTEGTLITIPNSSIRIVENLSNGWSRVDLSIQISHETSVDQAMRVIESVAIHMSRDWQWQDRIIEPPQMLGVDNLDNQGPTLRIWIKVQPLAQWDVAREFRRRLKIAFDQNGIRIPHPQQDLWFRNGLETRRHALSREESRALLQMVAERNRSSPSQDSDLENHAGSAP